MKNAGKEKKEDRGELVIQFGGGTLRLPVNIPGLNKKIIKEQEEKSERD